MSMESDIKDSFFSAVIKEDIAVIKEFLKDEGIRPWKFIETKGFTALHRATFNDSYEIVSLILKEMKNRGVVEEKIKKFVNKPTDYGFRAIHYAAYRGNIDMVNLLIDSGADVQIKTRKGLSAVHLACQGDHPQALIYFAEKFKLELNSKDKFGSTPLHWASYVGSELCVNFLIYRYKAFIDINQRDNEGLTASHLAVMSEKPKIVKKLIHAGADLSIKDSKNRTAADLAVQKGKKAVDKVFKSYSNNICSLHQKDLSGGNSSIYMIIFILAHLSVFLIAYFGLLHGLLDNFLNQYQNYYLFDYTYIFLFSIIMILFLFLIMRDPGFVTTEGNNNKNEVIQLIEKKINIRNFCPICIIPKHNDVRHCYICNLCVDSFDHHCYWIGNCIGKNNKTQFILFIILVMANIILNFFIGLFSVTFINKFPEISNAVGWKILACYYIIALAGFFFIPLFIVLFINCGNFCKKSSVILDESIRDSEGSDSFDMKRNLILNSNASIVSSLNSENASIKEKDKEDSQISFNYDFGYGKDESEAKGLLKFEYA